MAAHNPKASGSPSGDAAGGVFAGQLVLWDELTRDEVAAFKTALDAARDESDMQRFLEAHPRLLIQHLAAERYSWVIPKKRLGSEHETDFVIAQKTSDGFVWYAVELERPQAKIFNKNGDQSAALTHALRQIDDWRDWLSHNRDYASRPRGRSGLNLTDIHPELEGMVIIGRDADFDRRSTAPRRQRLERAHRVKIETYDWLLSQASDRLTGLEKKALNIMGRSPLIDSLNAFERSRKLPKAEAEQVVIEVFGGISTGWTAPSRVRNEVEWEGVEIWPDPDGMDNNLVVPFKIVYGQRSLTDKLLQKGDWLEWDGYVTEVLDADYGLLITEIEPDESLQEHLIRVREGVWYAQWHPWEVAVLRHGNLRVLVHLPPDASYDEKRSRVAEAREGFRYWIPDPALERERDAEQEREAERRIRSLSLAPGDMINHDTFGEGLCSVHIW